MEYVLDAMEYNIDAVLRTQYVSGEQSRGFADSDNHSSITRHK